MNEREEIKNLFNLVLFELEKYCSTVANHPMVSHDSHYNDLRTKKAPIHRAIHWYLHDNGLVYQASGRRMDVDREEYAIMWNLKNFDKKIACEKIIEKYSDYLNYFREDFEEMKFMVDTGIEEVLRNNGLGKELDETFDSLTKIYYDNNEIVISEYNKVLLNKYAFLIFNK